MSHYSVGDVVKGTILKRDVGHVQLQVSDDVMAEASGEQIAGNIGRRCALDIAYNVLTHLSLSYISKIGQQLILSSFA